MTAISSPPWAARQVSIFACTSCDWTTAPRSPPVLPAISLSPQHDGGQAQFIDLPLPSLEQSDLFAETMAWVQEHLNEPLTVSDMAARSAMSPRTFARRFLATTGTTPHHWLQGQRVHLAQRLLETSDLPVEVVAESSGFCTAGNLRKHFGRIVHTSPQAYRRTFQDRHGR